jgi:acetyltransferase-like isoleucine patch superfamily enzyme
MNASNVFVHPQAIVDTTEIGGGTRIWAFTHVMNGARIGRNCNIGEHCFIEHDVIIGDDAVIKNGVSIWEGLTVEPHVFIGPNAVFTNDLTPRAKLFRESVPTVVREGASIGANATIRCGVVVGRWALIGAGAVVTRDVPDFAIVIGNPGRVSGYACCCGKRLQCEDNVAVCDCGRKFHCQDGRIDISEPPGIPTLEPSVNNGENL